ncbi:hypothetical protein ACH5RR_038695 [Cinchona calisaya]|uniref:Uncharacterized protein n=1 Tax=Cinchona calisaya TaxID=153742 RepID=A0ABD2XW10_9GENT
MRNCLDSRRNPSPPLRSSSALISEIEGQLTELRGIVGKWDEALVDIASVAGMRLGSVAGLRDITTTATIDPSPKKEKKD